MAVNQYSQEEKREFLEEFNESGQTVGTFARNNGIPESTFRGWLNEDVAFGKIQVKQSNATTAKASKNTMIFACESIRIELKENFDKELLKNIMGVLINA